MFPERRGLYSTRQQGCGSAARTTFLSGGGGLGGSTWFSSAWVQVPPHPVRNTNTTTGTGSERPEWSRPIREPDPDPILSEPPSHPRKRRVYVDSVQTCTAGPVSNQKRPTAFSNWRKNSKRIRPEHTHTHTPRERGSILNAFFCSLCIS